MDNTRTFVADIEVSDEEAADLKAAIQKMFDEMERANARIATNQADIEKLKAETRAMLSDLRTAA